MASLPSAATIANTIVAFKPTRSSGLVARPRRRTCSAPGRADLGRDVVVLERGEDPLGELVARLRRRGVGDHVVRGAVDAVRVVVGARHHATSCS